MFAVSCAPHLASMKQVSKVLVGSVSIGLGGAIDACILGMHVLRTDSSIFSEPPSGDGLSPKIPASPC